MNEEIENTGDDGTFLYPRWREAVKMFLESNFAPGDIIEHSWFFDAFGIEEPGPATLAKDADKARLAFLAQFGPMRAVLLRENKIDLVSVLGVGYKIIPPQEQTAEAYEDGITDIAKGLRKMTERIFSVNLMVLDDTQRSENAKAMARAATLQNLFSDTRKRLGDGT